MTKDATIVSNVSYSSDFDYGCNTKHYHSFRD
jgi:hypothetical protein